MATEKRYANGRAIEFPENSNWREVWKDIRILAIERDVTIGEVVLEALEQYVQAQKGKSQKKR